MVHPSRLFLIVIEFLLLPPFLMRKISLGLASISVFLLPTLTFALPGVGNRLTVAGTIERVTITADQKFNGWGGEVVLRATNGQAVTVVMNKYTRIISEGRTSRKEARPVDLKVDMTVRITGLRLGTDSMSASVVIVTNVERNPVLAANGIITAVGTDSVTILNQSGKPQTFSVNIDTQIVVDYSLYGTSALTFIGKQALITINPDNSSQAKIIRIREASRRNAPEASQSDFSLEQRRVVST